MCLKKDKGRDLRIMKNSDKGFFGKFGGRFVPEALEKLLIELEEAFLHYINDKELSIYGSQGQHRTSILSLKLAEVEIIKEEIGETPILLLDDFMSELDEKRREHFLEKIENTQVIITCTDKINLANKNILIYNVKSGKTFRET